MIHSFDEKTTQIGKYEQSIVNITCNQKNIHEDQISSDN